MRDLHFPGRSPAYGMNGAAATSQPLATITAIDILKQGGNAVDAAIAACAVQGVVEPMSTGPGGDCFALIQPRGTGRVIGINGSGWAPAGLTIDKVRADGLSAIPLTNNPHAVTVPCAVDAWCRLAEDYGRLGIDRLLAPAIRFAEEGFVVSPRVWLDWSRAESRLRQNREAAEMFLPGGKCPAIGDVVHFPAMAAGLREIARFGRDGFYDGWVMEDMVETLRALGGVHNEEDFAEMRSEYVEPLRLSYRDREVVQIPPNGQGLTAMAMINMLKAFDLASLDPLGAERFHLEAEATRLAYQMRDRYIADPRKADVPVDYLLGEDYAREQAARIDPKRAMGPLPPLTTARYRDTVYISVIDSDGTAVSFINSVYFSFGSCIVAPKSGIVLQNRGAGFVLDADHPNALAPRKRPKHTIIPAMVLKDGACELSYGVMGGDYQPVGQVHVLHNIYEYGMDVQQALDCPRAFHIEDVMEVERSVPEDVRARLAALGHDVRLAEMPWGGGQAIMADRGRGVLIGGSDPRKDGVALAY